MFQRQPYCVKSELYMLLRVSLAQPALLPLQKHYIWCGNHELHSTDAAGSDNEAVPDAAEAAPAHVHWLMTANHGTESLAPNTYFAGGQPILREEVRAWEHDLKALLFCWASKHEAYGFDAIAAVLQHLKAASDWNPPNGANSAIMSDLQPEQFHSMLRGLEQKGMLPMLTFSFARRQCEELAGKFP